MNNLYKKFEMDADVEKKGVWINLGQISDEDERIMRIRVRRAGGANTDFGVKFEEVMRPYRNVSANEAQARKAMHELYAHAVVAAWENIPDENNNLIEFSTENCIKLFQNLPEVYRLVKIESENLDLFRRSLREADAKN